MFANALNITITIIMQCYCLCNHSTQDKKSQLTFDQREQMAKVMRISGYLVCVIITQSMDKISRAKILAMSHILCIGTKKSPTAQVTQKEMMGGTHA